MAARDKEKMVTWRVTRQDRPSAETLDNIRQWQRHYRKAFPQFVFYFDSIPQDVRGKLARQVIALGAVSSLCCSGRAVDGPFDLNVGCHHANPYSVRRNSSRV